MDDAAHFHHALRGDQNLDPDGFHDAQTEYHSGFQLCHDDHKHCHHDAHGQCCFVVAHHCHDVADARNRHGVQPSVCPAYARYDVWPYQTSLYLDVASIP